MNVKDKKPSFDGEQVIALPIEVLSKCRNLPLIQHLHINRMGIFPHAVNHFYVRKAGKASYAVLLHCFDGEGWVKIGGKTIVLKIGDAFFIPPLLAHSYGASKSNPWSLFWIHISGTHVSQLIEAVNLNAPETPIHAPYSEHRTDLFNQIFQTFSKGLSISNLMYANLILPNYLATFISHRSFHDLTQKTAPENNLANQAILYMQQHIGKKVTVDELAENACISSSIFFKKFKQDTGYSPVAYFNFLKIQKAIQVMHTQKCNVSEVGFHIGIDDPYYFSRLFKKQMGVSPRKYIDEFLKKEKG